MIDIRDGQAREEAATTFTRNVVVTASAGTGKTTLLISRLVHVIAGTPADPRDPVMLRVVALTFMEKAANEIKIKLRERLQSLIDQPDSGPVAELMKGYHLSADELRMRAAAAIRDLEKSQIGTIHSFAAHLLRLYPLEAGVDPTFKPDEGLRFDEHFAQEWTTWLDGELGASGPRHAMWRKVLRGADLKALEEFVKALVNDLIPFDALKAQASGDAIHPALQSWLGERQRRAGELSAAHCEADKKPRQVEKLLAAAGKLFGLVLRGGTAAIGDMGDDARAFLQEKDPGSKPPAGWHDDEFDDARDLIKTAKAVLKADHAYFRDLLDLVMPFAAQCRRRFLETGLVSYDGLLARARDLLRDHPSIRRKLKRQFKAILVDEFQDTDPVQYEMLLFLAEREDDAARTWQDVRLHPGKVFIVGDPKQSIFAFRRADIEAFQEVTRRMVEQGARELPLTTNFRSHATILSAVNGLFGRLIRQRDRLQPPYSRLEAQPDRQGGADTQGVELRLVAPSRHGEEETYLNAEQAVEAEAEALARWLKTEVIGQGMLTDQDGRRRTVEPGDVAILFRTFSQSWEYLGALRRQGLPYVAEGEKHFYQRQEVIDLVNLLRCIQNPHDQVALVGLLRSVVGALTDREIMELAERGAVDYRAPRLDGHPRAAHLRRVYAALESLHRDCPLRALPDVLNLVFERLPVLELAAASVHGEQAVANLWKVRVLAEEVAAEPVMTLAGFVELLKGRIADPPDESESGLSEETSRAAVRVMSMHKSKGLEFPIVVLVGLQAGTKSQRDPIQVQHDWSTGVLGLRLGDRWTVGGVYVAGKLDDRMAAEQRRLLYVGMTRAKERLVLSGALTRRQTTGNFLGLLREGLGEAVGSRDAPVLTVDEGSIAQQIVPADEGTPRKRTRTGKRSVVHDLEGLEARWRARLDRFDKSRAGSVCLTPSMLEGSPRGSAQSPPAAPAMTIGSLVHRILESWSYHDKIEVMLEEFDRDAPRWLPEEFQGNPTEIMKEARTVLEAFVRSEAYAELQDATILGREIPFMMPWAGPPPTIMEGRIDLLYEKDGGLWVADYKTDRVAEADIPDRMELYRPQAEAYTNAVRQSLGRTPAGFKLIFLRLGTSVQVNV
nr:UvrD-helicase domain-containing protein [Nitrospirota bacterium]